ncbi:MAG TPA: methyl-accepting chemotaxis protein [Patescibacteria group bacterium]|nr:methyl-accepting chemotaxis protein [Patescibacteria group bacterium]
MHRESRKKPVLTSPWKIGILVALLLVVICVGTAYYMIRTYDVELQWSSFEAGRWSIDSFLFFREMYVLLAALIAVSLTSYFLVASAVRRYKFYLDSGQDYRKMISLADSIDDLTNPAQIARLSGYPELQNVLRNYGDQIREVSQELEQREQEHRSVDLEMEIESLLHGEPVQEGVVEGKWWAPLFKKLEKYTKDNQEIIADIENRVEQIRRIFCNVVLSNGKVLEAASGAGEDLVEIMRAIGELNSIAGELGAQAADESPVPSGPGTDGLDSTIARMEDSLRRLEQGGKVMNEFSEENNGLALSIAIMAAKGGAADKDLARFAEKARTTAERFKRLGADIMAVASELAGYCRSARRGCGSNGSCGETAYPALHDDLSEISMRIEQHTQSLQQKITSLNVEIEDIQELVQQGLSKLEISGSTGVPAGDEGEKERPEQRGDSSIVNFGVDSGDRSDDESDLVIDHGKMWEDEAFSCEPEVHDTASDDPAAAAPSDEIAGDVATPFAHETVHEDAMDDDECSGEAMGGTDTENMMDGGMDHVSPGHGTESVEAVGDDSWMQMPGQRWLKVDVEKSEPEPPIDIKVREDRSVLGSTAPAGERRATEDVTMERDDSPVTGETEACADDGELIYDLFELGAVEYVEETKRH